MFFNDEDRELARIRFTVLAGHLGRIEARLSRLTRMVVGARATEERIMHTLQDTVAAVTAQEGEVASLGAAFDGLRKQVADALAQVGNLTPEQQAALDQVFDHVTANTAAIHAAMQSPPNATAPEVTPVPEAPPADPAPAAPTS